MVGLTRRIGWRVEISHCWLSVTFSSGLQVYTVEKGRVPSHVIIALLGLSPDLQIPEASEVCPFPDSNLFIFPVYYYFLSSKNYIK